jgi:hypothetical protein
VKDVLSFCVSDETSHRVSIDSVCILSLHAVIEKRIGKEKERYREKERSRVSLSYFYSFLYFKFHAGNLLKNRNHTNVSKNENI